MDTHLLPNNSDGCFDKQKLTDKRDNRKSIGIYKTTLNKRVKPAKLFLKKYCGNEIKNRIKHSLQLGKLTNPTSATELCPNNQLTSSSYSVKSIKVPPPLVANNVNVDNFDDQIDEKENHQPTIQTIVDSNRVILADAPSALVNKNIIANNCNRTHRNSIIYDTNIISLNNYNYTSHSIDAYAATTSNMSMYDYHYDLASNSTNGSSGLGSNKYMTAAGGKAHSTNDSSTFYCTDLVTKQQLCDIALSMASLCNIGNSCYMNSVLYTLRFTPLFLHNLHHLVQDFVQIVNRRETQMRLKSSSLGRNVSGLQGQSSRSYSSKDLASLGAAPSSTSPTSSSTSSSLASTSTASATATGLLTNSAATAATAATAANASASTTTTTAAGSGNATGAINSNISTNSTTNATTITTTTTFDVIKTTQQNAMEKLHELFKNLTSNEVNETTEPYQSDLFLKAIQDVNPIFEGNQQQDAHEFLMCILDSIRELCQTLTKLITEHPEIAFNNFVEQFERAMTVKQVINAQPASEKKSNWFKRRKDDKNKIITIESPSKDSNSFDSTASITDIDRVSGTANEIPSMSKEMVRDKIKALGLDFFSKDFEGVTASSIQCLACETTTEQKETMIDLAVPITENMETTDLSDSFIQNLCITRERFSGDNKFRCENCMGLTEAIRKISYPKLPRLLIIQLKRFSGGMEKINSYIPTPFTLQCFCSTCINDLGSQSAKEHEYQLYSVITHVGSTLQAGHYIAYTSSLNQHNAFIDCFKDINRKEFTLLSSNTNANVTSAAPNAPPPSTSLSSVTLSSTTSVMKKIGLGRKKSSSTNADAHKNVKGVNGLKMNSTNGMDSTLGGSVDGAAGQPNNTTSRQPCPSSTCCAIKMKSHLPATACASSNGNEAATLTNGADSSSSNDHGRKGPTVHSSYGDPFYSSHNSGGSHSSGANSHIHVPSKMQFEPIWYMCDDDKIKAIPQHEFREMLLPKKNMITPYLLFYARKDVFESH